MVIVPEGNRECVIVEELGEDPLVEVEVPSMEGKEEPVSMDLEEEVGRVVLVIDSVAISTMDVGLLGEGTRVFGG